MREVHDLGEVMDADLGSIGMSELQRRRYRAAANRVPYTTAASAASAAASVPATAALASMDPAVIEWFQSCRLGPFAEAIATLGVEECRDLAELSAADLRELGLSELQRRRFHEHAQRSAATGATQDDAPSLDVPPEAREGGTLTALDKAVVDTLSKSRVYRFAYKLASLGVREVHDLGEVMDADLGSIGMSELQRRRYRAAANRVPYTTAASAASAAASVPATAALASMDPAVIEWIERCRLGPCAASIAALGVEERVDLGEVTEEDLDSLGLTELQRRRFKVNATRSAKEVIACSPLGSATAAGGAKPASKATKRQPAATSGASPSSNATPAEPASLPQQGSRAYFAQFGFDCNSSCSQR